MNASAQHSEAARIPKPEVSDAPFHIVLLHDGATALKGARHMVETIIGKHLYDVEVHRDELSFAEVMHPELRAETTQIAAGCDVLVFATVDGSHLPGAIATWLENWLEMRPEKETALLSIVGTKAGVVSTSSVEDYLRHVAATHGISFFSSSLTLPEDDEDMKAGAQAPATRVPHNVRPRPERWGLNE
jgi:hypothetical protein